MTDSKGADSKRIPPLRRGLNPKKKNDDSKRKRRQLALKKGGKRMEGMREKANSRRRERQTKREKETREKITAAYDDSGF